MVKERVDTRIFHSSFKLDFEDIVSAIAPTKEHETKLFTYNHQAFRLCDVSGQRHQIQSWQLWRPKNTCAVMYVMNLMDYILTDSQGCRLKTSREIFKELLMTFAKPTKIVLIMNKFDLFKTQLASQPLVNSPSFSDNSDACRREGEKDHAYATRCKHLISHIFVTAFDEVIEKKKWKLKSQEKGELFSYHSSCATDRCFVQSVMDTVMNDVAQHEKMLKQNDKASDSEKNK
jgi:hypothetical protein